MNPFNLQIIYTTNYCNWNRRTFKGGKEKNRKILIIMKDGWRAGVRRAAREKLTRGSVKMKGGNGATIGSAVMLCLKYEISY